MPPQLKATRSSTPPDQIAGQSSMGIRVLHVTEAPKGGVLTYLVNLVETQIVAPGIELVHVLGPSVNEPALRECRSPKLESRQHSVPASFGLDLTPIGYVNAARPSAGAPRHCARTFQPRRRGGPALSAPVA